MLVWFLESYFYFFFLNEFSEFKKFAIILNFPVKLLQIHVRHCFVKVLYAKGQEVNVILLR
jgi:hypothetical protein